MHDYRALLSVVSLCLHNRTESKYRLAKELIAASAETVGQLGEVPGPIHPDIRIRIFEAARDGNRRLIELSWVEPI